MPAGDWGKRMVLHRTPAWHLNALVTLEPMTAEEAVVAGRMDYPITRQPLYLPDSDNPGKYLLIPEYQAIIRGAEGDDAAKVIGIRPKDFNTFDGPMEVARIWDTTVNHHIETIGVLAEGEILFITAELPTSAIGGDEHKNYIFADINFGGSDSAYARATKTRVVCINTYAFARSNSQTVIRINHKGDIRAQLAAGLENIWESAVKQSQQQDQALTHLVSVKMEADPFAEMLEVTYPEPNPPIQRPKEDKADYALRLKRFELSRDRCLARRNVVRSLFHGERPAKSPDAFTQACKGTAYGALQAVLEEVDWNTPQSSSPRSRTISEVNGEKATMKARALDYLLDMAGVSA